MAALTACDEPVYVDYELPNTRYPVPRGDVAATDWASALARAECSRAERCRNLSVSAAEGCVTLNANRLEDALGPKQDALIADPGWDAAAFGACVATYATQPCMRVNRDVHASFKACVDRRYYATGEAGSACRVSDSCVDGTFCAGSGTPPGVCQPFAELNAACKGEEHCGPKAVCSGVCVAADRAEGHSCHLYPDDCAPGLVCTQGPQGDSTGTCRRATGKPAVLERLEVALVGGACETGKAICDVGLICSNASEGKCVYPRAEGQRCDRRREKLRVCGGGLFCDLTGRNVGRCHKLPGVGEPCADDWIRCASGATCVEETCAPTTAPARLGDPCDHNGKCFSGQCDEESATCVPQL